jgi:hypothetical protein
MQLLGRSHKTEVFGYDLKSGQLVQIDCTHMFPLKIELPGFFVYLTVLKQLLSISLLGAQV